MFEWVNDTSFPKLTDIFNYSDFENINYFDVFTHLWVSLLGQWFFGMLIGAIGAALYVKYNNAPITLVYFLVMSLLFSAVLPAMFLFLVGALSGILIGIAIYLTFIKE